MHNPWMQVTVVPMRPTEDGYHEVIGECYIDGFMDGRALPGPLPTYWEGVRLYHEELSYCLAFVNLETGNTEIEDLRLGLPPDGWRVARHDA